MLILFYQSEMYSVRDGNYMFHSHPNVVTGLKRGILQCVLNCSVKERHSFNVDTN